MEIPIRKGWKCEVCLGWVVDEKARKCPSCEALRPGLNQADEDAKADALAGLFRASKNTGILI